MALKRGTDDHLGSVAGIPLLGNTQLRFCVSLDMMLKRDSMFSDVMKTVAFHGGVEKILEGHNKGLEA